MFSRQALRRAAAGAGGQVRRLSQVQKLAVGGRGGRSTSSGKRVVVFGAGGFLGRYVCNVLGQQGHVTVLPNRGCEMEYRHLHPMFDLGQAAYPLYHGKDEASIRAAVAGADMVISLVGKQYETKAMVPTKRADGTTTRVNFTYEEANAVIPATIARIAKEEGADTFVHVSALNQDAESESAWARAKAMGEDMVKDAFPEATIIRPAVMFGSEDTFVNYFTAGAWFPFTPVVKDGEVLVQPVYVGDVARAVVNAMNSKKAAGKTYELVGPDEYTLREVAEYVYDLTGLPNNLLDVPVGALKLAGDVINNVPSFGRPFFTKDHAIMMATGSVKAADSPYGGLDALKVEPHTLEKIGWSYLHRHRAGGHFVLASGYHKDVKTD